MAYDPNDPKDKATVQTLIDAALAEQAEEHEASIEGLKTKNTKLIADLKKARAGEGGDSAAEVERLEGELAKVQADLKAATKSLDKITKERDELATERDGLSKNLEGVLIDNALSAALAEAKVDGKLFSGAMAVLRPKAALKLEGDERKAFVGDKSLGDFVKEWAGSDEGKAYVSAAGNSGGGAGGSQGGQGGQAGKTWTRAEYDAADQSARAAFFSDGGKLSD